MTTRKATTVAASTYATLAKQKIIDRREWDSLNGKPVVLTKGTFDILHGGHLALFNFCARKANELGSDARVAVVVETDESVRARKGINRPYQDQSRRALQIALLANVDAVLLADKNELAEALDVVRPRVYVKGMDTAGGGQLSESQHSTVDLGVDKNQELKVLDNACEIIVFTDNGSLSTSSLVRIIQRTDQ